MQMFGQWVTAQGRAQRKWAEVEGQERARRERRTLITPTHKSLAEIVARLQCSADSVWECVKRGSEQTEKERCAAEKEAGEMRRTDKKKEAFV